MIHYADANVVGKPCNNILNMNAKANSISFKALLVYNKSLLLGILSILILFICNFFPD